MDQIEKWAEQARKMKEKTGNEYMVVQRGPNDLQVWPVRNAPDTVHIMYRTEDENGD